MGDMADMDDMDENNENFGRPVFPHGRKKDKLYFVLFILPGRKGNLNSS